MSASLIGRSGSSASRLSTTSCRCRSRARASLLANDMAVPWFGPRVVCTKCGIVGADGRPNWSGESQHVDAPPALGGWLLPTIPNRFGTPGSFCLAQQRALAPVLGDEVHN